MKRVATLPRPGQRPTRMEAEQAVETLLRYIGEDTSRPGLADTPARVVRAYDEYFAGYMDDPAGILSRVFDDLRGYDDFVLVRNIDFVSHCEHHMAPIIGVAHVAYWPDMHVTGLSKLSRIVDCYARRLTCQENMIRAIAGAINAHLKPKGVAIIIDAAHHCMSMRGTRKSASTTLTSHFTGLFEQDADIKRRFLDMACAGRGQS